MAEGLTKLEIRRLTERYLGTSGGYLGSFKSRPQLEKFYLDCDVDVDLHDFKGTNLQKFVQVLESVDAKTQAKIVSGVLRSHPPTNVGHRTEELYDQFVLIALRLDGTSPVNPNMSKNPEGRS